ncbi:hypothetical protein LTR36_000945 [Oleoguttula mirabilis]|uniref:BTB domain-containing protein n=1 Tax=Oleoguttula mirabilis TaxID=1507867 RepID=A0AAV9JP05_9PEZI|nr:hypothetical protein LTR36_000945 [Oleoguttula mirabilis]
MAKDFRCSVDELADFKAPVIAIIVGEGSTSTFYVDERLICQQSAFFKAALSKSWTEGARRVVRLPDEEEKVVHAYLHWLYHNKVACLDTENDGYSLLASLYVFGEKLLDKTFKDVIIDCIIATSRGLVVKDGTTNMHRFPAKESVDILYQGTSEGSPARQMLVDMHQVYAKETWINGDANHDFLVELTTALIRNDRYTASARLHNGACAYHCHGKDEQCPSKRAE